LVQLSTGVLHAEEYIESKGEKKRVVVSFGPKHGPITANQVHQAVQEAAACDILIMAGFSFGPEAQAYIQKVNLGKLQIKFAYICPDVLVDDLLKTQKGSQLFTVFGEPDIEIIKQKDGQFRVNLRGIDYYDPTTGKTEHKHGANIAMWMLDQDYDGDVFYSYQVFFPNRAKNKQPWDKLEKSLKGFVDKTRIEALTGFKSTQFRPGDNMKIAVKVIDVRGNEVIGIRSLHDIG